MNQQEKQQILIKAQAWFQTSIVTNHIKNTEKLKNPTEFNINPFMTVYLANFLTGNSSAHSLAKALVYPRVLGTSITTSFGTHIQKFTSVVLSAFGSTTAGIDIEFIDHLDGHKKYCQMKSGPDTINKDDVETIANHFKAIINLSRTNNLRISHDDMIVGVLYGEPSDLNGHYKRLEKEYYFPVFTGQNFWHRLTGDENFYYELIAAIAEVAIQANYAEELDDVINQLAQSAPIQALASKTQNMT
jgi:hypothetical protein